MCPFKSGLAATVSVPMCLPVKLTWLAVASPFYGLYFYGRNVTTAYLLSAESVVRRMDQTFWIMAASLVI